MREFIVRKGCLGYTVTIGCQVCGFTKVKELKKAICEYLDDPDGMEKKYYNEKGIGTLAIRRYPDVEVSPMLRGEDAKEEVAQVNTTRR